MNRYTACAFMAGLGLATSGWCSVITSGSAGETTGTGVTITNISLTGSNFSIVISAPPTFFPNMPPGSTFNSCPSHVCTMDFSQTGTLTTASQPVFTITLDGTTYSSTDGDRLNLSLGFASSIVAVNQSFTPLPGGESDSASWSNVPFTFTGGSFSIFNGASLLASDTLTGGGGLASGSSSVNTVVGEGSSTVSYQFSTVPEPATSALVGAGILAAAFVVRKRAAKA